MKRLLIAGIAAAALGAPAPALAQAVPAPSSSATSPSAWTPPRNAWGQPVIEGNWSNATLTPQARPAEYGGRLVMTETEAQAAEAAALEQIERGNRPTDPNAPNVTDGTVGGYNRAYLDPGSRVMRVRGEPRTSLITTPDGMPPKPRAGAPMPKALLDILTRANYYRIDEFGSAAGETEHEQARRSDDPEGLPQSERCLSSFGRNAPPPMFSNGLYNNNYAIAQNRDEVLIVVEMVHEQRHIRLNSRAHLPPHIRPWGGDSVGWFEGDSLVVETTNFPRQEAYLGAWEQLKVTEWFTRTAPDRLHYRFAIEDPTIWEGPWGGEYEFSPLDGPVLEYACHEGNYAMPGILAGSRRQDRLDAEAAARPAASGPPGRAPDIGQGPSAP